MVSVFKETARLDDVGFFCYKRQRHLCILGTSEHFSRTINAILLCVGTAWSGIEQEQRGAQLKCYTLPLSLSLSLSHTLFEGNSAILWPVCSDAV